MIKTLSPAGQVLFFIFLVVFMSIFAELIWGISISIVVGDEMIAHTNWNDARIYLSRVLFSQVFSFLLSFMLFLRFTGEDFSTVVFINKSNLQRIGLTLIFAVTSLLFFPVLEWLNEPLRSLLPGSLLATEAITDDLQMRLVFSDDGIQYVFLIITLALLPAIFEELVFRGLLIHKMLQSGMSETGAILMSAAVFALSHFQPMKFLALFFLGAALGFIYRKFGNIKYSMLFHFLINGSQITVGYLTASGIIGEGWL